jgi:PRTRC genetic system protein E
MVVKLAEEVLPHVSKITIIIAGTAEALTLAMLSDKKEKGGIPVLPINIKGTAAEVEAELANAIKLVFADNKQVFSNAVEAAEAVKVAATKPASTSTKSKSKTSTKKDEDEKDDDKDDDDEKEEVKPEPIKLSPTQTKVQKDQKKNFDRAEKATDPDVVNFVENEIAKAYKTALMPESIMQELKEKFDGIRNKLGKPKEEAPGTGMFAGAAEQSKQASVAPTTEHKVEPKVEPKVEEKPKVEEAKAAPAAAPAAQAPAEEEEIIF